MSNRLTFQPPSVSRRFVNTAGNPVVTPSPSFPAAELDSFAVWISALFVTTAVTSAFGPASTTLSNLAGTVDSGPANFAGITGAHYFAFMGRLKDGATTALVDNTVNIFFGAKPVGRITVHAATQKVGLFFVHTGGTAKDIRFLTGATATALSAGTIEESDNVYTKTAGTHGLETGDRVVLTSLTGGTGVTAGSTYFFHKLSPSTGYLCSSYANALAGTAMNVTLDGSAVILTIPNDIGIEQTTVDPALELFVEGGFED